MLALKASLRPKFINAVCVLYLIQLRKLSDKYIMLTYYDLFETVPKGFASFCRRCPSYPESVPLHLCQNTHHQSWICLHLVLHKF